MADDLSVAFDTVEARSIATAVAVCDRIAVRDYVRSVEIGAFQSERDVEQRIRFNVVLEVAPHDGAVADDVDQVLSYDTITEAIEAELSAGRLNLLETLAELIAGRILRHGQARRVFVRIEKLDRIPGTLGVEIERSRADDAEAAIAAEVVPRMVLLPNDIIAGDDLAAWIDRLINPERPSILCVEPCAGAPGSEDPAADRRLQLLAMDQSAWVLAGRDRRCVVADNRTELDWALKNGQLSVWAPSRLVLDAVEGPASISAQDLAVWLGAAFGAGGFTVCGRGHDARFDVAATPEAL